MRPEDVKDRETLRAYLEALPEEERRTVALRVASNAALRVLPIAAREFLKADWARKRDLTPIAVFGACSISMVARKMSNVETISAARVSSNAVFLNYESGLDFLADRVAAHAALANNVDASQQAVVAANAADTVLDAVTASATIKFWLLIHRDLSDEEAPVWPHSPPLEITQIWEETKTALRTRDEGWDIWIHCYERVTSGQNWHPEAMWEVLQTFTKKEDWQGNVAEINAKFAPVLELYLAEQSSGSPSGDVAEASYFDFVEIERTMRAVSFQGDQNAFANDEERSAFLEALSDLRMDLEDWCELARAQLQGRNHPLTAVVAIEMLFDQFDSLARDESVSLRDLVRRGSRARRLARGKELEDALGSELSQMLSESLDSYSEVVRAYLGHILEVLDVLRQLDLGDLSSRDALHSLKSGMERLFSQDEAVLLPPDARTRAILNDFLAELEDEEAEIEEATTEVARQQRRKRFAERFGGAAATIRQYAEKGSEFASNAGGKLDQLKKWAGRWDTIQKIIDWLDKIPPGGGGP